MAMNRQQIIQLLPELQTFLTTLRYFSWLLIFISVTGYAVAVWLWSIESILTALFVASVSFILFSQGKPKLIKLSCWYLHQDPHYHACIDFIHKNLAIKSEQTFITQLHLAINVIQKNSHDKNNKPTASKQ
jgi:hypothetical protein